MKYVNEFMFENLFKLLIFSHFSFYFYLGVIAVCSRVWRNAEQNPSNLILSNIFYLFLELALPRGEKIYALVNGSVQ